jgi:acyl carrier protein
MLRKRLEYCTLTALDKPLLNLETSFSDSGIDSLEFLCLLDAVEKEFQILIPEEKASEFETFADLLAYLESVC